MIIWVNGAFGAGKTTTGMRVAGRDDRLRQLPSWRGPTPVVAD